MNFLRIITLCSIFLLGIMPIAAFADRYTLLEGDNLGEVRDNETHLIWRLCVEGMVFDNGICIGEPVKYSVVDAFKRAQTQASPGKNWRLPNIKELISISSATCIIRYGCGSDGFFKLGSTFSDPYKSEFYDRMFFSSTPDVMYYKPLNTGVLSEAVILALYFNAPPNLPYIGTVFYQHTWMPDYIHGFIRLVRQG